MVNWTDPTAVAARLTQLASLVVTILTALHPGWHEPEVVATAVPAVGLVIAGVVQVIESWRHATIAKAQITADLQKSLAAK